MILAGDIGATKTVLALFAPDAHGSGELLHESRFASRDYDSLEAIVELFLKQVPVRPAAASFGVPGPVKDQQSQVTNLSWSISAETLSARFGIGKVFLLNDLEAVATVLPHLRTEDLATINPGLAEPDGTISIVAPGTGLGTAFLVWTGKRYKAMASEGGHSSFAPATPEQVELLEFLQRKYGHVSFERLCSGSHLSNIYDFYLQQGRYPEPDWLREELAGLSDRTPVIIQNGLQEKTQICTAVLDMFVQTLATVIGNMAVTLLPRGGIYLGGGIPPRILQRLQRPDFIEAVTEKGRFSDLCAAMPLHVILKSNAGLLGAARFGIDALAD